MRCCWSESHLRAFAVQISSVRVCWRIKRHHPPHMLRPRLPLPAMQVVTQRMPQIIARLQQHMIHTAAAAPLLKQYVQKYKIVAPYFEAKAGDPVERFAAEAAKHPVFEILPG